MGRGDGVPGQAVEVLVVGAGIGGVGAAIRLLGEGVEDFVVLEKAESLGGTWRDNTYPGAACDVPSAHVLLSSTKKNRTGAEVFAGQKQKILDYVRAVAERHGLWSGLSVTASRCRMRTGTRAPGAGLCAASRACTARAC